MPTVSRSGVGTITGSSGARGRAGAGSGDWGVVVEIRVECAVASVGTSESAQNEVERPDEGALWPWAWMGGG